MPKQTTEQQVLYNLASIYAIKFCKKHDIDCSGSHLIKQPRKQAYHLIRTETKKIIMVVIFYKNSTPSYFIDKD